MEHHFPSNLLPYNGNGHQQHQLTPLSHLSNEHHYSQNSAGEHHTLPPLQPQNAPSAQYPPTYSYAGLPQTSHTLHTPATASMPSNHTSAFSNTAPPPNTRSMQPPSAYTLASPFAMTQSMMPPASTATSTAMQYPSAAAQGRLPELRPTPQGELGQDMLPSFNSSPAVLSSQPHYLQNQKFSTQHVVGPQGRRGILPSAPGRVTPSTATCSTPAKSMMPQKDAEGKFPCPHCNKTYLHAKHLKRHLLRHTGDRPYMCHLCKDTFSRSDILKRHFQKCSQRRGNPTGAGHLAHHRGRNGSTRSSAGNADQLGLTIPGSDLTLPSQPFANGDMSNGMEGNTAMSSDPPSYPPSIDDFSARSSRANSLIRPGSVGGDTRNAFSGLGISSLTSHNMQDSPYSRMTNSLGTGLPQYTIQGQPPGYNNFSNGYAYNNPSVRGSAGTHNNTLKAEDVNGLGYARQSLHFNSANNSDGSHDGDWAQMFQPGGQDSFMGQSGAGNGHVSIKAEGGLQEPDYTSSNGHSGDMYGGLYSQSSGLGGGAEAHDLPGFPNWNMDTVQHDPLQRKANELLSLCYAGHVSRQSDEATHEEMRNYLTVDNIRHFVGQYLNFQGHWPIVHMPTFSLLDVNHGLLLAIISIGAVYSDRLNVGQSRRMMEAARRAIQRSSRTYGPVTAGRTLAGPALGSSSSDIEELQALILMHTMYTWHGTPEQRETARSEFGWIVQIARQLGLMQVVPPGTNGCSVLHQNAQIAQDAQAAFEWTKWVEQEKKTRALFVLFLADTAMVMYQNCAPHIDPFEIRLPLPADDATWDAKTSKDCANALGLNGQAAQSNNTAGSRRPRQPDMRTAMRSLMEPSYGFQPCSTNAYSKFILIHALHVLIWKVQRNQMT
ncbi:hypothetical protein LTR66_004412, partial [Elasticomyces elasticus]